MTPRGATGGRGAGSTLTGSGRDERGFRRPAWGSWAALPGRAAPRGRGPAAGGGARPGGGRGSGGGAGGARVGEQVGVAQAELGDAAVEDGGGDRHVAVGAGQLAEQPQQAGVARQPQAQLLRQGGGVGRQGLALLLGQGAG